MDVDLGEEQLVAGELHSEVDADEAHVAHGAGAAHGLHERLLGADRFDDGVRAEPVGEFLHRPHPGSRVQHNPPSSGVKAHHVLVAEDDYCYLTTTGRRSGCPHRIEVWYAAEGPTLYLLAGG